MSRTPPIIHQENQPAFPLSKASFCREWVAREIAIAIIVTLALILTSWAVHNVNALSGVLHIDMAQVPAWAYKCLLAASCVFAFRSFIFRPLIRRLGRREIYPAEGKARTVDYSWTNHPNVQQFSQKISGGNIIHFSLIQGDNRSGETIIYSLGNNQIFDVVSCDRYLALVNQGNTLYFYHPPGYGDSTGPRTPESDFLAIEAVLEHANRTTNMNNISLRGLSLGSTCVCALAEKYPLKSLSLIIPLSSTESVMQRHTGRMSGLAKFLCGTAVNDFFGYDNAAQLARINAPLITIDEGAQDEIMTLPTHVESEAMKLQKAWKKRFEGHYSTETTSNDLLPYVKTVFKAPTQTLIFRSWKNHGHNSGLAELLAETDMTRSPHIEAI